MVFLCCSFSYSLLQPLKENELLDFINKSYKPSESSINELINSILNFLSTKSSKFKYIINSTTILINEISNNKINNSFGSLWDEKNDGFLNLKFKSNLNEWTILSIIFISI